MSVDLSKIKAKHAEANGYLVKPSVDLKGLLTLDRCSFKKEWVSGRTPTYWVALVVYLNGELQTFLSWRWGPRNDLKEGSHAVGSPNGNIQYAVDTYTNYVKKILDRDYALVDRQTTLTSPVLQSSMDTVLLSDKSRKAPTITNTPQAFAIGDYHYGDLAGKTVFKPVIVIARAPEKDWW